MVEVDKPFVWQHINRDTNGKAVGFPVANPTQGVGSVLLGVVDTQEISGPDAVAIETNGNDGELITPTLPIDLKEVSESNLNQILQIFMSSCEIGEISQLATLAKRCYPPKFITDAVTSPSGCTMRFVEEDETKYLDIFMLGRYMDVDRLKRGDVVLLEAINDYLETNKANIPWWDPGVFEGMADSAKYSVPYIHGFTNKLHKSVSREGFDVSGVRVNINIMNANFYRLVLDGRGTSVGLVNEHSGFDLTPRAKELLAILGPVLEKHSDKVPKEVSGVLAAASKFVGHDEKQDPLPDGESHVSLVHYECQLVDVVIPVKFFS